MKSSDYKPFNIPLTKERTRSVRWWAGITNQQAEMINSLVLTQMYWRSPKQKVEGIASGERHKEKN